MIEASVCVFAMSALDSSSSSSTTWSSEFFRVCNIRLLNDFVNILQVRSTDDSFTCPFQFVQNIHTVENTNCVSYSSRNSHVRATSTSHALGSCNKSSKF